MEIIDTIHTKVMFFSLQISPFDENYFEDLKEFLTQLNASQEQFRTLL